MHRSRMMCVACPGGLRCRCAVRRILSQIVILVCGPLRGRIPQILAASIPVGQSQVPVRKPHVVYAFISAGLAQTLLSFACAAFRPRSPYPSRFPRGIAHSFLQRRRQEGSTQLLRLLVDSSFRVQLHSASWPTLRSTSWCGLRTG